MGNLAIMMQSLGHDVHGSDGKLYPPMSDLLQQAKIKVFEGYSAQRLEKLNPDLVVVGNVISRGNEEIEWLLNTKRYPICSLPELIHNQIIGSRDSIVITGTHGKTTTTALTTYLLDINQQKPGYFIGGAPKNYPSGANYGNANSPFVIEGDEYDSAFFDKRSKFIHYAPKILIINNIELDHIDIFRDLQDIQRSFRHLIKLVPSNGYIIANGDAENVRQLLPVSWAPTVFVGKSEHNDYIICDEQFTAHGTQFTLRGKTESISLTIPLFGEHNVRNVAMATVAAKHYLGDLKNIDLSGFRGVKKRQEVIYNDQNTVIIEDFAHHPTAIHETICAIRQAFPGYHLITTFEPRSNTACSPCFQETFINSFRGSDEVYISEIFKNKSNALDINLLANNIHYCPAHTTSQEKIKHDFPQKINGDKQVFLFLSNGDFGGVAKFLRPA